MPIDLNDRKITDTYLGRHFDAPNSGIRRSRTDFEPASSFQRGLGVYSLESGKILANYNQQTKRGWFRGALGGYGGIPLSFDEQNKYVFFDNSDTHSLILGSTGSQKTRLIALLHLCALWKG